MKYFLCRCRQKGEKQVLFVLLILSSFSLFSQQEIILLENNAEQYYDSVDSIYVIKIKELEIPKIQETDVVIRHLGYSFLYNESHEQSSWVAYVLSREKTIKNVERSNNFAPDPDVKTGTACNKDYAGSGYDKGHLAPAADMSWSQISMRESFYFSNMSPQIPGFNRGIWKKLEEMVRTWAVENDSIYVVTGPVLTEGLETIGETKVSVPKYFYKVILDYTEPDIKGIGFILPNESSILNLADFAVSIDSVESFTGLDFFYNLPDEQENVIEKSLCISCWSWKTVKLNNEKIENGKPVSVQCSEITQSGTQCKRMTKSPNGKCYQHGGD